MTSAKKTGALRLYKSYSFTNKDPIIDKTRTVVQDSGMSYQEIHEKSGVTVQTLNNWFAGDTKKPQFCTLEAVGRACGKTLGWVDLPNKKK